VDRGHPRLPRPFVFVDDVFSLRIAASTLAHVGAIRTVPGYRKSSGGKARVSRRSQPQAKQSRRGAEATTENSARNPPKGRGTNTASLRRGSRASSGQVPPRPPNHQRRRTPAFPIQSIGVRFWVPARRHHRTPETGGQNNAPRLWSLRPYIHLTDGRARVTYESLRSFGEEGFTVCCAKDGPSAR